MLQYRYCQYKRKDMDHLDSKFMILPDILFQNEHRCWKFTQEITSIIFKINYLDRL